MHPRSFVAAIACVFLISIVEASAQVQHNLSAPAQQPDYQLRSDTRIVLTDVTVTDRDGKPVHGLKSSDFQIFDNKTPQTLSLFEEHTTQTVSSIPQSTVAPAVYSNEFLQHLPPFLNVMVIDIKNIEIEDQLYLNYKLTQFINMLPAGEPLAVYWCRGRNTILLQSFTSDHALLLAAVHKAIPRFPPTGREFYSDFATLQQIAADLGQFPGRKNILWFTGGSTLFRRGNGGGFLPDFQDEANARRAYDEIEASRVAIYPIDARGLTVLGANPENTSAWGQHGQMLEIAEATGGHAYYSNNGFDAIAAHLLDSDGSFYTLTYSPRDFRIDNKWHKVQIKLTGDSPYQLSYRRGYFADGSGSTDHSGNTQASRQPRRLLGGGTVPAEDPDLRSVPIIFQVKVQPAAGLSATQAAANVVLPFDPAKQKRGTVLYTLRYSVPLDAFTIQTVEDNPKAELGLAVVAFNQSGSIAVSAADQVILSIHKEKLPLASKTLVSIEQRIGLPEGDDSLYCAVWDMASHRLGTIRVPLEVTKKN